MTVTDVLHKFGIPTSLKGYLYLREVILSCILDERSNIFYLGVAEKNRTTVQKVDRNIRYAIEIGWNRLDLEISNDYFGNSYCCSKGKPTNKEFILTIADRIKMDYEWSE